MRIGFRGPWVELEEDRSTGGFPKLGVPFCGIFSKDSGILGSILGPAYLGKL